MNNNDVKQYMQIKTVAQLDSLDDLDIPEKNRITRKPNAVGKVVSMVPGLGGDVWWVTHPDGGTAVYSCKEFEPYKTPSLQEITEARRRYFIVTGAARALFVMAYSKYCEEHPDDFSLQRPKPGGDWMDAAPNTPMFVNAFQYDFAEKLIAKIEEMNQISIVQAWLAASRKVKMSQDWLDGIDTGEKEPTIGSFGHCLAMEALGNGVSWSDYFPPHNLNLPRIEYYLERDTDGFYEVTSGL